MKMNLNNTLFSIFLIFSILLFLNVFKVFNFINFINKDYLGALLTTVLIMVAWTQLVGIKKIGQADFLLRLDTRSGSSTIIKAKCIFHKIYLETKSPDICKDVHIKKIQEKLKDLGLNKESAKEFTYLLNFLDYLETVAYFANNKHVSHSEVNNLLGGTIEYYYKVFSAWIHYRRNKYKDESYYQELQTFVERAKNYKV